MAEAYIRGLERRLEEGKSVDINSVASFFVSRVDTEVDKRLEGTGHDDLLGQGRHRQRARRLPALRGDLPGRALRRPARRRRRRAAPAVGLDRRQEPGLPRRRCTSRSSSGPTPSTPCRWPRCWRPATTPRSAAPTAARTRARSSRRWPTPASTWWTSPTSCCARASTSSSSRWRSCSRASAPSARRSSPSARRRSTPRCPTTTSSRAWPRASSGPRRRTSPGASGARTTRSGARRASPRWPTASGGWT